MNIRLEPKMKHIFTAICLCLICFLGCSRDEFKTVDMLDFETAL